MGLRSCEFLTEYRSGYDNLIQDFYHPALKQSHQYWRAAGFFSSTALEAIGSPLGDFIRRGGKMRLITSVHLQDEDIQAIEQGLDRQAVCEQRLLEQIQIDFAAPFGRGSALLMSLLQLDRLEIRISLPKSGRGIYHEKVGIYLDDVGDYVSFAGSPNESRSGLEINYECIDVFPSWEDDSRALAKRRHFELLWEGKARGADTFSFPEAVKRDLLRIFEDSQEARQFNVRTPATSTGRLWPHQSEAVQHFLDKRRGVLEMATGTGKTRTALHLCQRLLTENAIQTIIVSTDGNDLLDQWYIHLLDLTRQLSQRFRVLRHYQSYYERDNFILDPQHTILLISRPNLAPALRNLSPEDAANTFLIHDEVHRLGSPGNRQSLGTLSTPIPYRLGLSATPDREYDSVGNAFIESHVGPVLYRFGLEDAIRSSILAPFTYHAIEYTPDADDRFRLKQVWKKATARRSEFMGRRKSTVFSKARRLLSGRSFSSRPTPQPTPDHDQSGTQFRRRNDTVHDDRTGRDEARISSAEGLGQIPSPGVRELLRLRRRVSGTASQPQPHECAIGH
ncbi:DEAD/DEAH box helicase family protein [Lacunimicrobium album]